MIKLLIAILTISSLTSCAGIKRPDTDLSVVNVPFSELESYNMLKDYDDNGILLPTAVKKITPITGLGDVNKFTCVSPQGFANLKAYVAKLKQHLQDSCQTTKY